MLTEILGPAAAGKTTLVRALVARAPDLVVSPRCARWRYLPTVIRLRRRFLVPGGRAAAPSWRELRAAVYVEAWYDLVRRPSRLAGSSVVFDHGPLFRLVRLRELAPESALDPAYRRWWTEALDRWSDAMDLVVWLDAPTEVLAGRLRARPTPHRLKHGSDGEIAAFLARYRGRYAELLGRLAGRRPRILPFDTSETGPAPLAEGVLAALGRRRCPAGRSG